MYAIRSYYADLDLVTDLAACEDAYESERTGVLPLLGAAQPGQLWMADRHFCTRTILQSLQQARADFIVRQNARHPRIVHRITSYNVCYTKLLRRLCKPNCQRNGLNNRKATPASLSLVRSAAPSPRLPKPSNKQCTCTPRLVITSYSIHYTKLYENGVRLALT